MGRVNTGASCTAGPSSSRYTNVAKKIQVAPSQALRTWRIRGITGKFQALARILKAWITFDGGFDYIIWKLERHSGRHIDVPERVRRRPALHMWGFFWRLYRDGIFR